jgi:protein-disulfide isomerase
MKNLLTTLTLSMVIVLSGVVIGTTEEITIDEDKLREIIKEVIKENPKLILDTVNRYIKEQRKKRQIQQLESSFKNRIPYTVSDNNPLKGSLSAPITIIEYTDFQCPYCSRGATTVYKLLEMYPEKVKLVFKNNPLENNPLSVLCVSVVKKILPVSTDITLNGIKRTLNPYPAFLDYMYINHCSFHILMSQQFMNRMVN